MTKKKGTLLALTILVSASAVDAQIIVNDYFATYTQDFNNLPTTGTSSTLPTGWFFSESGTNANTLFTAGTGSSTTGDTYNFGSTSATDRALGGLQSGSLIPTIGAQFQNGGSETILSIAISYRGEEWRYGATGRADRLDFQFSLDANSLTSGTWTDLDVLDFSSPNTPAITGALDGNASGNFSTFGPTAITGLNVQPGASIWIRWTDFNASGSDDGLGVDDVSVSYVATPEPTTAIALLGGTAFLTGIIRRRRS